MSSTRLSFARALTVVALAAGVVAIPAATSPAQAAGVAPSGLSFTDAWTYSFYNRQSGARETWFGQRPSQFNGVLAFGGVTYRGAFSINGFACSGDPTILPCGASATPITGSLQVVSRPTNPSQALSGSCAMPYFPGGTGYINCAVHLAAANGSSGQDYPLHLKVNENLVTGVVQSALDDVAAEMRCGLDGPQGECLNLYVYAGGPVDLPYDGLFTQL